MNSNWVEVKVKVLPNRRGLELPRYMTDGSAGMDLQAAIPEPMALMPGQRYLVPTGLAIALPEGWEAQVRPRSGLAVKYGITVLNAPGTIDADYRGEIQVLLINHGDEVVFIEHGMRVAQLVFARVAQAQWTPVVELDETARATGGFGSTGA